MPTITKHATRVRTQSNTTAPKLTGEALISFISGSQTNIGRATFYNMKEEQRQSLFNQHAPVLEQARPFYTLISLSNGINDVNRQLIAWNLIGRTFREENLKDVEHSPTTKWENEVILQAFDDMPVPRVLDFYAGLANKKVHYKRAVFLVREWLKRNKGKWPLWTIKYRSDFRKVLRYVLRYSRKSNRHPQLQELYRYIKFDETKNTLPQLVKDYEAVKGGDQSKLPKLPITVAEGFQQKFGLSKAAFEKLFSEGGGKRTAREKLLRDASTKKAGVDSGFDVEKAKLWDLLVYLRSLSKLPKSRKEIESLLKRKAKEMARKLSFELDNVAVILDTSKSMEGTKDQPYHPMLRAMAISMILREVSNGFKEYRTNESSYLFPKLSNQSNYASAVMKALKDGCETIVLVGDGYENAPFEGALHQLLFTYKQTIDKKKNRLMVLHFNPVFAAEAMDVRSMSEMVSQVGIRQIEGLNEGMFLAIARTKPMLAIQKYLKHLVNLQDDKCKVLMPQYVEKLTTARNFNLIT